MRPPVLEVRLILSAAGAGWEYSIRRHGEVIAASDGDAYYADAGKALIAGFAEVKAHLAASRQGDAASMPDEGASA